MAAPAKCGNSIIAQEWESARTTGASRAPDECVLGDDGARNGLVRALTVRGGARVPRPSLCLKVQGREPEHRGDEARSDALWRKPNWQARGE